MNTGPARKLAEVAFDWLNAVRAWHVSGAASDWPNHSTLTATAFTMFFFFFYHARSHLDDDEKNTVNLADLMCLYL